MLPISAKELVPFTPPGCEGAEHPPVYHIAVPTIRSRAAWRRYLALHNVRYPAAFEVAECMRKAVRACTPPEQHDELLAVIAAGEGQPVDETGGGGEAFAELLRHLRRASPELAGLMADREEFLELSPWLVCAFFVKKAENAGPELAFAPDGTLSEASLAALDPLHVFQISMKIRDLMELGEAQAKNSESLSRSPSPPAATTSE